MGSQPILSRHEISLLRGLLQGREQALPSSHRLRFELLGLIRDRPHGVELTASGKQRLLAPMIAKDSAEAAAATSGTAAAWQAR